MDGRLVAKVCIPKSIMQKGTDTAYTRILVTG